MLKLQLWSLMMFVSLMNRFSWTLMDYSWLKWPSCPTSMRRCQNRAGWAHLCPVAIQSTEENQTMSIDFWWWYNILFCCFLFVIIYDLNDVDTRKGFYRRIDCFLMICICKSIGCWWRYFLSFQNLIPAVGPVHQFKRGIGFLIFSILYPNINCVWVDVIFV